MGTRSALFLVGALLSAMLGACKDPPPRELVVRAGRLIDGTGTRARTDMRVLIRDGEITAVEADEGALPTGAAVVDARQWTVMPGLVDCHVHLMTSSACTPGVGAGTGRAVRNLRAYARGGVTTVADLALPPAMAAGLRSYVGTARHRGPRVLVSGSMLTAKGGYLTTVNDGELVSLGMVRELVNPDAARQAVRELAEGQMDLIKVALQSRNYDQTPLTILDRETLCALVDEAHIQSMRVAAHAIAADGFEMGLDCGVDAFAHGPIEPLTDDLLQALARTQTSVAPTSYVFAAFGYGPDHAESLFTMPWFRWQLTDEIEQDLLRYAEAYRLGGEYLPLSFMKNIRRKDSIEGAAANRGNTQRLHKSGVPLAFGSDSSQCFNPAGAPALELGLWVEDGLTPVEAIAAATQGSARVLGLEDAISKVALGFRADLIAVDGKPDVRIDDVAHVKLIIIDGVVQEIDEPGFVDTVQAWLHLAWAYLSAMAGARGS